MIIIITHEHGGFDKHSQEIAKRVKAKPFHSQRYFNSKTLPEFLERLELCDDVVHISNQNFARFAGVLKVPFVITVHDLIRNFYDFDGESLPEQAWLKLDEHFIKRAEAIITVSEFTKNELITRLGISPSKITTIYNGIDHSILRPVGDHLRALQPYVLYVGSERPRKNLKRLVEALSLVRQKHPELTLLKVGEVGRDSTFAHTWREATKELKVPTAFAGKVSEESLARLYRGATMLVFPSLMEGFGMPLTEAMACGCPVVVSDTPVSREIVGNAGWYVDPLSSEDIASGIEAMLERCEEFIPLGLERAKLFSWDAAAKKTQEVYDKVEGR